MCRQKEEPTRSKCSVPKMAQRRLRLYPCLALLWLELAEAWNVSNLTGIWKLTTDELPRSEPPIVDPALGCKTTACELLQRSAVYLKLNQDGSFRQCNEGYVEGFWISGWWALLEKRRIKLALNRSYYGPRYDMILDGQIRGDDDKGQVVVSGNVYKGKLSLPRTDPMFFCRQLENQQLLGPFLLSRTVAASMETSFLFEGALLEDDGVFL